MRLKERSPTPPAPEARSPFHLIRTPWVHCPCGLLAYLLPSRASLWQQARHPKTLNSSLGFLLALVPRKVSPKAVTDLSQLSFSWAPFPFSVGLAGMYWECRTFGACASPPLPGPFSRLVETCFLLGLNSESFLAVACSEIPREGSAFHPYCSPQRTLRLCPRTVPEATPMTQQVFVCLFVCLLKRERERTRVCASGGGAEGEGENLKQAPVQSPMQGDISEHVGVGGPWAPLCVELRPSPLS